MLDRSRLGSPLQDRANYSDSSYLAISGIILLEVKKYNGTHTIFVFHMNI